MSQLPDLEELGKRLGTGFTSKYRLLARLGGGGMATVYRGRHTQLDIQVAIKIQTKKADFEEASLERFHFEAKAAAMVQHPNVVRVHDFGTQGDFWWMASELVEGRSLADILDRESTFSTQKTLKASRDIALGLRAIHDAGIVHRDIKPENVLVGADEVYKISDLGLAKAAGRGFLTESGVVLGTPAYMAPEQILDKEVGPRADLYALGTMMYRMVSGKLPFEGPTEFGLIDQKIRADHPPIQVSQLAPEIKKPLARLIDSLLARDQEVRPETAQHVVDAIEELYSSDPSLEPLSSPGFRLPGEVRIPAAPRVPLQTRRTQDSGSPSRQTRSPSGADPASGGTGRVAAGSPSRSAPRTVRVSATSSGSSARSAGPANPVVARPGWLKTGAVALVVIVIVVGVVALRRPAPALSVKLAVSATEIVVGCDEPLEVTCRVGQAVPASGQWSKTDRRCVVPVPAGGVATDWDFREALKIEIKGADTRFGLGIPAVPRLLEANRDGLISVPVPALTSPTWSVMLDRAGEQAADCALSLDGEQPVVKVRSELCRKPTADPVQLKRITGEGSAGSSAAGRRPVRVVLELACSRRIGVGYAEVERLPRQVRVDEELKALGGRKALGERYQQSALLGPEDAALVNGVLARLYAPTEVAAAGLDTASMVAAIRSYLSNVDVEFGRRLAVYNWVCQTAYPCVIARAIRSTKPAVDVADVLRSFREVMVTNYTAANLPPLDSTCRPLPPLWCERETEQFNAGMNTAYLGRSIGEQSMDATPRAIILLRVVPESPSLPPQLLAVWQTPWTNLQTVHPETPGPDTPEIGLRLILFNLARGSILEVAFPGTDLAKRAVCVTNVDHTDIDSGCAESGGDVNRTTWRSFARVSVEVRMRIPRTAFGDRPPRAVALRYTLREDRTLHPRTGDFCLCFKAEWFRP
ncbi:MAG: serine/threonine protein kinase [Candidatus Riflebacteria bacterium]|nr:serine/threonine protein kinase [Candidatus Riflebacteria bacterium]